MDRKAPRPVRAYSFPNGMLMVFDQHGDQMQEYQGRTEMILPKLRAIAPIPVFLARWHGDRDNPIEIVGYGPMMGRIKGEH